MLVHDVGRPPRAHEDAARHSFLRPQEVAAIRERVAPNVQSEGHRALFAASLDQRIKWMSVDQRGAIYF